jgi:preprotein translocase subunit SecD
MIICGLCSLSVCRSQESKIKSTRPDSFKGTVKIAIGNVNDDPEMIKKTLTQISKRVDHLSVSISNLDKNIYECKVKKTEDTIAVKKLLTKSVKIEFLEAFTINEIANGLQEMDTELKRKQTEPEKMNAPQITEKDRPRQSLSELVRFTNPYSFNNRIVFPAEIGYIQTKDTSYFNKLLGEENIRKNFPASLKFAYGSYRGRPNMKDSVVRLYAVKLTEPKTELYPTAKQISETRVVSDRLTKTQTIVFQLNPAGSQAWHVMTKKNIGRTIVILVDDLVISAPMVETPIDNGNTSLTTDYTTSECIYFSKLMGSSELILSVKILESHFSVN